MNDQNTKAHDLFLLMFNLSQMTAEKRIVEVFMQAIKEMWPGTPVSFLSAKTDYENDVIEIVVSASNYGFIKINKLTDLKTDDQDLLHNAVAMLAIILKKNEQDKLLAHEKLHLQNLVDQKVNAIKLSEKKYNNIFDNIQDVYYETSMEGIILEVSPSIEFLSKGQYSREDLLGKSMLEFYTESESRQDLLLLLQGNGRINDYEIMLRNRDGSMIPCSITAKHQRDSSGCSVKIIGSMRDITERKQAESQREAALKEIQEINEELEQRINERTAELRKTIVQLEELNRVFVGRELKMMELKERIAELEKNVKREVKKDEIRFTNDDSRAKR